jgi:hypothetical protein
MKVLERVRGLATEPLRTRRQTGPGRFGRDDRIRVGRQDTKDEEGSLVAALLGMTGAGEAESGEAGGWHESAKAAARLPHSKAPASEGGC